jgi:hypothetical protein
MRWKRVALLSTLFFVLVIPLIVSTSDVLSSGSQPDAYSPDGIETRQPIMPVDQAVLSDSNQYVYGVEESGYGDVLDFANLLDADSDFARLVEVDIDTTILTAFSFQRTFLFSCEAFDYLTCKLEVRGYDYSGISGYAPESLIFYCRDSPVDDWVEIGTLSGTASTSYSWEITVPTDDTLYVKAESPITAFDWGSQNEWRLEYLRLACIDRKSSNVGVRVDTTFDGDNLYPYRGASTNDYYRFECIASNEEGGGLIDYMHLIAKREGGPYLWGVTWQGTAWSLDVWSKGVNLLESLCSASVSGRYRTAVFAVQLRYDCEQVSDIDLQLYHESDTWHSTTVYDRDYGGRDLDQEPSLAFKTSPTLPSRCNPSGSPTLSGSLVFAQSPSNTTPHPSHTYVRVTRTEPAPSGEWSGGTLVTASGLFVLDCLTKGTAGTVNTFRARVYESSSLNDYTGLQVTAQTLCDEVIAYEYGAENNTVPLGATTTIFTRLRYRSDGAAITTGTVRWQALSMTYSPENERWETTPPAQTSPISISYNTLVVVTDEGVTRMFSQPTVSVTWTRLNIALHIDATTPIALVSTPYDPRPFHINLWITDENGLLVSGWLNLTIGGEEFAVFVDGTNYSTFSYYSRLVGIYTIEVTYEGDAYHEPAYQIMTGLTALGRDVTFDNTFPTDMAALIASEFTLLNVYDNEYQGVFNGVTYIRDYPVDFQMAVWWTLDPEYIGPLNYVGLWNGTDGLCVASWALPWDLDGNGRLRDNDFLCFVIVVLDGMGVYNDVTFRIPVQVTHALDISLEVPALVFSDLTTITIRVQAAEDPTYTGDYSTNMGLFFSHDNATWVLIDTISIGDSGQGTLNWECTESGTLYLKCETTSNSRFSQSLVFLECECEKESTHLTLLTVTSFTYSDQGVLTAYLSTDDNDPLSDYAIYLEIFDKVWVSIGSGLTNESGIASILWIPTLPEGEYMVRARAALTDSLYYRNPDASSVLLQVRRETIVLSIDQSAVSAGYLTAVVLDDEANPMEGIPVLFFRVGDAEPLGTVVTDSDGVSRLESNLQGSVMIRVSVDETEFFYGVSEEMVVNFPMDLSLATVAAASLFVVMAGIALSRKIIRGRSISGPPSVPPEVSEALREERDSIPERVREHSERRIAELDEMGREGEDGPSTMEERD